MSGARGGGVSLTHEHLEALGDVSLTLEDLNDLGDVVSPTLGEEDMGVAEVGNVVFEIDFLTNLGSYYNFDDELTNGQSKGETVGSRDVKFWTRLLNNVA